MQNAAARVVSCTRKFDHLSPVFRNLHWLPVKQRIYFKILLLTYKAINGLAPSYIVNMLEPCVNTKYSLRSSDLLMLNIPKSQYVRCGDRAFCVAAPKLWNALPLNIKKCKSVEQIKSMLKTHMFSKIGFLN